MLRVTKKMLANYLGIHQNNVGKHYRAYIDILQLKRDYLTVYDVAQLDCAPAKTVAQLMGIKNKRVLSML